MNPPTCGLSLRSPRLALLVAGCVLTTVAYFAIPSDVSAASTPVKHTYFTIDVKLNDIKSIQTSGSGSTNGKNSRGGSGTSNSRSGGFGSNGSGGFGSGGFGSRGSSSSDFNSQADVTYLITVKNITKFPVKNLQVKYDFYNLTTDTTSDGISTHTIDDITSTENVDIDAGQTCKPIQTQTIRRADSASAGNSQSSSSNNSSSQSFGRSRTGGKGMTTARQSTSITDLIGYHVETIFNGEVVGSLDSPIDLQDKLKQFAPRSDNNN